MSIERTLSVLLLLFRETFQNVKDTTTRLNDMNKKMVELTKQGEATEALESYVKLLSEVSRSVCFTNSVLNFFLKFLETYVSPTF